MCVCVCVCVCHDRGVGDSTLNFGGVCKGHFAHFKGPLLISRAELKGLAIPDLKGENLESLYLKAVNVKTTLPKCLVPTCTHTRLVPTCTAFT